MIFNKKNTYEQHDNEKGSFYKSSIRAFNSNDFLEDKIDVDVCIIGGGLTGVSSALHLCQRGYSVVICEARKIGWGASGRNGGQLGNGMRKDQFTIEKKLGFAHAKELWNLGLESVQIALDLIKQYNIDCNINQGVMSAGCFKTDIKDFEFEKNYLEKNYQYSDLDIINQKCIKNEISSEMYYSGLINKGSYHINPLKLLIGLANQLKNLNVKIFENTPITRIENFNDQIHLYSNLKKIRCNRVVVGCNGYLDKLLGKTRNKFMPINNYVIATEPLGEKKAREIIKNNYAVCDTRFILDYYRFTEDWRLIFGAGETYTASFMNDSMNFVRNRMVKVFPMLQNTNIDFSWGGTLAITSNRLPHFGEMYNNKLIFTHGYSGHGLALSILAGKLISEKISGASERFDLFSKIKHIYIPGGDALRRPIYSSAIFYYKLRDVLKSKI
ncbi:FAD-binding oxidoreductase [Alphaproteobacteria bacterium]|nr:FAD-binding oxidoreductase [Alphaproteobacteria bacterium]